MTPEQRDQVMSLVAVPGRGAPVPPDEFLHQFGATDGAALGLYLLRDAMDRQDATDLELALVVCAVFDVTAGHFDELVELLSADWHTSHEEVVTALGRYRSQNAVDPLYRVTQWIPDYLDWDDNRALAKKAVHALGAIPGPAADDTLRRLLTDNDEHVRETAKDVLNGR